MIMKGNFSIRYFIFTLSHHVPMNSLAHQQPFLNMREQQVLVFLEELFQLHVPSKHGEMRANANIALTF